MRLTIEFFGLAHRLTGAKETTLEVDQRATLRDIAAALGRRYPQMVGPLIKPGSGDLEPPYVFSLDGRVVPTSLDFAVRPNDRLVLMFIPAGG